MAREAIDVCLRVLKKSNKSRFDGYSVKKSALIMSHITFRDCRVHSFSDNLSRNSCIQFISLPPLTNVKSLSASSLHDDELRAQHLWTFSK